MKKWGIIGLLLACLGFMSVTAQAADNTFRTLDPAMPTETGKKIEVLEFFYYGCPHCFELEPLLNPWVAKLPADVEFRRLPAVFRDDWAPYGAVFFTFKAMGLLGKLHSPFFDAIHVDGLNLTGDKELGDWVAQRGVDRKKFLATYHSFTVQTEVNRARQQVVDYQVTGVPTLIVDGRYLTSSALAGGHPQVIGVLDKLIAKVRQERAQQNKK